MILVYKKNGYECRLFSLLNFPRAAILNIYDVTWVAQLLHTKERRFLTIAATI